MDLSIRDWVFVIVFMLVLVVLLDGYRRAQRSRRHQVRLSKNAKKMAKFSGQIEDEVPKEVVPEVNLAELPNGGARLAGDEAMAHSLGGLNEEDALDPLFVDPFKAQETQKAQQPVSQVDEPVVDSLAEMEDEQLASVEDTLHHDQTEMPEQEIDLGAGFEEAVASVANSASGLSTSSDNFDASLDEGLDDELGVSAPRITQSSGLSSDDAQSLESITASDLSASKNDDFDVDAAMNAAAQDLSAADKSTADESASSDTLDASVDKKHKSTRASSRLQKEAAREAQEYQPSLFDGKSQKEKLPDEIIVLNVLALQPEGFSGEDLLHVLLACDCRFGEMQIFHHFASSHSSEIDFSIVNMVKPGTFDLDNIKGFSTPGVSFFLRLPGPEKPIQAYEKMVEVAKLVARNLNGELRDEQHSTITRQTLEHGRERIRTYQKNLLLQA